MPAFFLAMADDPPYLKGHACTAGALSGVLFKDIYVTGLVFDPTR